ncbi:hypothetical protein C8R46DRAFT_1229928 [Mycena filopes]|nr:hypothetical protein C8R46DRAFT_1229928 [Mycena filopes]
MSTYTKYGAAAAPAAPAYGLFPAGATSPNAFAALHQSPRATHSMYAQFAAPAAPAQQPASSSSSGSKRDARTQLTTTMGVSTFHDHPRRPTVLLHTQQTIKFFGGEPDVQGTKSRQGPGPGPV